MNGDVERLPVSGSFDFVIVSNVVEYLIDVQDFLHHLSPVVHPSTRLVAAHYNLAWEPFLKLAERLGLKTRQPLQSWLSSVDLENLVELADLEPVITGYRTPIPEGPPLLMAPLNDLLSDLPFVRRLGLVSFVTAKPANPEVVPRVPEPSCTIVIWARNERGNIRGAVERIPRLGRHAGVLFIEGHSTDGTAEAIEAAIAEHPELDLKLVHQDGVGKGDAVRKGFELENGTC